MYDPHCVILRHRFILVDRAMLGVHLRSPIIYLISRGSCLIRGRCEGCSRGHFFTGPATLVVAVVVVDDGPVVIGDLTAIVAIVVIVVIFCVWWRDGGGRGWNEVEGFGRVPIEEDERSGRGEGNCVVNWRIDEVAI